MAKKINNKNNSCPLAIETSGHVAFRENNFIDDGAYLACKILIQIILLKQKQKNLQDLITNYKSPVNEINMRFDIDTNNNIEKVFSDLEILARSGKNIELDSENIEGVRVHFPAKHQNGFLLLRKSLHDNRLILYAESYVANGLKSILDFTKQFLKKYPEVKNNSLFAYVLVLLKRLPNEKTKMAMLNAVQAVIEEYQDDVDLTLIGFPENYMTLLKNNVN